MPIVNSKINDTQLFHDLESMGRNNFSYDGAKALMEYLDNLEDECDMNIEYDPIGFCCEYTEYADLEDFNESYNSNDPFETWEEVMENTTVILFNHDSAIVQDF
jgi:hypothetical protein